MGRTATSRTRLDERRPRTTVGDIAESFTTIALVGAIDLFVAPELMERVRSAIEDGATRLVFDLTDATFIDSTTLGTFVSAHKRVQPAGGWIGIACPDPTMARIFAITGLDRMFAVRARLDAFDVGSATPPSQGPRPSLSTPPAVPPARAA